ncbi:dipeptidase [Dehalobacter sp. MCB1]|uniref:M20/M25/M40 family metallo-hydrolase n=1 Tax=Dehalobacter sp. MCB1 TaxID=1844756 RepID=UPI00037077AD|nr:M20/M25/M40 family metallo-hydrolase [Dehalobacter sp. MCB1]RJE49249.1 dipeptidase [Dehalobacter sp. MCB1]
MDNLEQIIASQQEDMIKSLQKCLRIKSITGQQDGVIEVLEFYLGLAQKMGFNASNLDNLGGIIEFGQGDKTIGMIVHLDTVPEGTGWNHPPFEGYLQDEKIFGRGAIDDKGPAIAVLYALNAVKTAGIHPYCKVQIIIGLDEENVWNTTPKLLEKIKEPDFSFVPDSVFPVVCAEKGLLWLELKKEFRKDTNQLDGQQGHKNRQSLQNYQNRQNGRSSMTVKQLSGGADSLNIVPDFCEAVLTADLSQVQSVRQALKTFLAETGYDLQAEEHEEGLKLISRGKSVHAFNCQEGSNAISQLIVFLSRLHIDEDQKNFIRLYAEKIGMQCFGEALGLYLEDKLTGKLTLSPGYIRMDPASVNLKMDLRFPSGHHLKEVRSLVESAFAVFQADLAVLDALESLNFPEDDPHIRKLIQVYQDHTGDKEAHPLGMGGTTFAKAFQRAVAFGPSFPGMPKIEHQPDEYIGTDHLINCTEIYARAIVELTR